MVIENPQSESAIWMIIPAFSPIIGGTERQAQQVSRLLSATGWRVHILTRRHHPACSNPLKAFEMVDGLPVTRLYSRGPAKISALLYVLSGLWYLLRHGRRGLYHAHDVGAAGWLALLARCLLGGRCLVKLRSGRHRYEKRYSPRWTRWQFLILLHLVDHIIVVNREVKNWLRDLGVSAERIVRIPNVVDIDRFYPASAEEKIDARRRLRLPLEKTILLWVGRLEPVKSLDVLLRAWALLPGEVHEEALLLLVGGGSEQNNLRAMTDRFGLQGSVLLTGPQYTIRDYYWAADIFVLPSRTEGLSNALLEASACGLPSVVSKVGGALDIVTDGETGLFFQVQDHVQLARKLKIMISASDQWVQMGNQARDVVRNYATADVVLKQLHELYRDLASTIR
jgi:glycosyltransferase involved in cell wall biosynthesis